MPRIFIDTDDGDDSSRDEVGFDLSNAEAAREMAMDALPDMAREKLPDGDGRTFVVRVRGENDETIYEATMTLKGAWHTRSG